MGRPLDIEVSCGIRVFLCIHEEAVANKNSLAALRVGIGLPKARPTADNCGLTPGRASGQQKPATNEYEKYSN